VCEELLARDISENAIEKLLPLFSFSGNNEETLAFLDSMFAEIEIGQKGVSEVRELLEYAQILKVDDNVFLDITLARGLNYYTGTIFEVKATDVAMGSISGGGRYDDLTGIFGLKNMSGVGISYGVERIYDVMEELQLFDAQLNTPIKVLFLNFGKQESRYVLPVLQHLRAKGIASEIYPDAAKIGKQMNYANAKDIPYVVIAGEDEMAQGCFTLKNMHSGEQRKIGEEELVESMNNEQ
jgi:histidyl-tRNA synthetase